MVNNKRNFVTEYLDQATRTFYYIQSSELKKILMKYNVYFIFSIKFIFSLFGLPLTFPLTCCSALQNFQCL